MQFNDHSALCLLNRNVLYGLYIDYILPSTPQSFKCSSSFGFPDHNFVCFSYLSRAAFPVHSILLDFIALQVFCEE